MKLAVLGGTTRAGHLFLKYVLENGYDVNVLLEFPAVLPFHHEHLAISYGSLDRETDVMQALEDSHAVIGMPDIPYTAGAMNVVVSCMYALGLRRLILSTDKLENLKRAADGPGLTGMLRQTPLDWTIIHATPLEASEITSVRDRGASDFKISMRQFATFLANQITDVSHLNKAIMISN